MSQRKYRFGPKPMNWNALSTTYTQKQQQEWDIEFAGKTTEEYKTEELKAFAIRLINMSKVKMEPLSDREKTYIIEKRQEKGK